MEQFNLFSTPIFKFKYDMNAELKSSVIPYLDDDSVFKENTVPGSHLHLTGPNLHKIEQFKTFKSFVQNSLEQTMQALGFEPNIQLTGLWATKHTELGAHHRHAHSNSFLAGVYYLSGYQEGLQPVPGTRFFNPNRSHCQIMPARTSNKQLMMMSEYNVPFVEGTLVVFPAWIEHTTMPNRTGIERYILGVNAMPLGLTNHDQYDRFNYQDISNADLISSRSQRVS
jgi:uncharacterized protein (TIGR02466 family)